MPQVSLYDVLLVDQHATVNEIKLAFKKRALQVHPDKGGSKEAFHLVYKALETLADPEARQKYDNGMANKSTDVLPEKSTRYKKTSKTCAHPTTQKEARPEKGQKPRKTNEELMEAIWKRNHENPKRLSPGKPSC